MISVLVAAALDDRGLVLLDADLLRPAEHGDRDVLELAAGVLGDELATGEDRDVLEHLLAAIAEARCLDGADLEDAAQPVDHERGESLALDLLGDDQERLARLRDLLEHGEQLAQVVDPLLVDEDEASSSSHSMVSG